MDIPAFIAIPIRALFLIAFLIFFVIGGTYVLIVDSARWFWRVVTDG